MDKWTRCTQEVEAGKLTKQGKEGKIVRKGSYPPKLSTLGITLSTIGVKALIFYFYCVIIRVL